MDEFNGAASQKKRLELDGKKVAYSPFRVQSIVEGHFRRLGLALHPLKRSFEESCVLEVLGFITDTARGLYMVPPDKLRELFIEPAG